MSKTINVAKVGELSPGDSKVVEVEGTSVALFNVDGMLYAIENTCTHVGGPLNEGSLVGNEVACPWHGARFDVTSGKMLSRPARSDVRSYPVKVDGDDVLVEVD